MELHQLPWRPLDPAVLPDLLGEVLPPSVHDVWCRPTPASPWALQLMIDDSDGEDWVYRRDPRLRRPKDEADLALAAPVLSPGARAWLRDALDLVSPGHEWAVRL